MKPLILLLLSIFFLLSATAFADPMLLDDQFSAAQKSAFEEVQGNIMSPYCPGRLLKDCPSTAARELKVSIKERILAGESAVQIREELLKEFGEDMRASPKVEGVGMLAWLAPIAFLLVGGIIISLWVWSQSNTEK